MGGFGFMKKGIIILSIVTLLFLSGCGKSSASYDEVIENVISYNHEICKEAYKDLDMLPEENPSWVEREDSNFTIWEDENNYYILIQYNHFSESKYSDEPEKIEKVLSEKYKVGKSNKRISDSYDDKKQVVNFYESNTESIYTEENVELVEDIIN